MIYYKFKCNGTIFENMQMAPSLLTDCGPPYLISLCKILDSISCSHWTSCWLSPNLISMDLSQSRVTLINNMFLNPLTKSSYLSANSSSTEKSDSSSSSELSSSLSLNSESSSSLSSFSPFASSSPSSYRNFHAPSFKNSSKSSLI